MKLKQKIKNSILLSSILMVTASGIVNADSIDSSRFKEVYVQKGDTINYEKFIGGGLPSGASLLVMRNVDTSFVHDDYARVKINFKDNTSQEMDMKVHVLESLSTTTEEVRTNNPVYHISPENVEKKVFRIGSPVTDNMILDAIYKVPTGSEKTILDSLDVNKAGEQKIRVKIVFPDKTEQIITLSITIADEETEKKLAEEMKNKIEKNLSNSNVSVAESRDGKYSIKKSDILTETVYAGDKIDLTDNIKNLPKGSKINVVNSPDTVYSGNYTGVVEVTFPDGSKKAINIPVNVLSKAQANNNITSNANSTVGSTNNNNAYTSSNNGNPKKGEAIKGEIVKTGDENKKGILPIFLSVGAGITASIGLIFYKKKKIK